FVEGDQERLEGLPASPSDHHEVVALDRLDLEPERAPLARYVEALPVLGDDSCQTLLEASLEELDAFLVDVLGSVEVAARGHGSGEMLLAGAQRLAEGWAAFQVEDVEGQVGGRALLFARRSSQAIPEQLRVGPAVRVGDQQHPIQNRARRPEVAALPEFLQATR